MILAAALAPIAKAPAAPDDLPWSLGEATRMIFGPENGVELTLLPDEVIGDPPDLGWAMESDDEEIQSFLRSFYLDIEALIAQIIAEGQQSGVFRRTLDPRVGAWEMIRSGLGYTLTQPLGIPLYTESDYMNHAIECLLHCLLKTDV